MPSATANSGRSLIMSEVYSPTQNEVVSYAVSIPPTASSVRRQVRRSGMRSARALNESTTMILGRYCVRRSWIRSGTASGCESRPSPTYS